MPLHKNLLITKNDSFDSQCDFTLLKDLKGMFTIDVDKKCSSLKVCEIQLAVYIETTSFRFETNSKLTLHGFLPLFTYL